MSPFRTTRLPTRRTAVAPDGSDVRVLLASSAGSMAHFELAAGAASRAVVHRTVEELWYVIAGAGELWRKHGAHEEIVALQPGVCASLPRGTHFQFRAAADSAVAVVAVTMPPWPGDDEAVAVEGIWQAGRNDASPGDERAGSS